MSPEDIDALIQALRESDGAVRAVLDLLGEPPEDATVTVAEVRAALRRGIRDARGACSCSGGSEVSVWGRPDPVRRRAAADCERAGRHLELSLESDEPPRCGHCGAALSAEDLRAAGVTVTSVNETTNAHEQLGANGWPRGWPTPVTGLPRRINTATPADPFVYRTGRNPYDRCGPAGGPGDPDTVR